MPFVEWEHSRGMMHGLADGEIRLKSSDMNVFLTVKGPDNIYPDGAITDEALKQLKELTTINKNSFFLAVGIIKPHLPFGAPKSYFDQYEGVHFLQ